MNKPLQLVAMLIFVAVVAAGACYISGEDRCTLFYSLGAAKKGRFTCRQNRVDLRIVPDIKRTPLFLEAVGDGRLSASSAE
jgi:hypothetical protein